MWRLLILVGACVTLTQAIDLTVEAKAKGSVVVDAVVDLVSQTCNFENDKLMLRYLAKAESNDGEAAHTFDHSGTPFHGGIWQISEADFDLTKAATTHHEALLASFGIDWSLVVWKDLEKPLYSGIAARIKISITVVIDIPWTCEDQADFWMTQYIPGNPNALRADYMLACGLAGNCEVPRADLQFVLDGSGSIGSDNFDKVRRFVTSVVKAFTVSKDDVHVGLIQFSSDAKVEFTLDEFTSSGKVIRGVKDMVYAGGKTYSDKALRLMNEQMSLYGRSQEGVPSIAIFLTDGQSTDSKATAREAKAVHLESYTVFAIGITDNVNQKELNQIGSNPDCLHVYTIDSFQDIEHFVKQIERMACRAPALLPPGIDIGGIIDSGQAFFFQLTVKKTKGGVSVKVSMATGSTQLYMSWTIRNPSQAVYDFSHAIDSTMVDGGLIYIPWDDQLLGQVDTANLYGVLVGDAFGDTNKYTLQYQDGYFSNGAARVAPPLLAALALAVVSQLLAMAFRV